MKSTKWHFKLESGEYIVDADNKSAINYKILYKGKDITNSVIAIIRYKND